MWFAIFLVIFLTFLQVVLAPFLTIGGTNLNLLLGFLLLAAFNLSLEKGFALAFLGGLIFDLLTLRLLGTTSFFLMVVVLAVTVLKGVLFSNKTLTFLCLWLIGFWAWGIFLKGGLFFPTLPGTVFNLLGLLPLSFLQRVLSDENRS